MPRKQSSAAPVLDASPKKLSARKSRNRPIREITLRPDLAEFADSFFPKTKYKFLSRFVDAKLLQFARVKRKELKKLGIPQPKDEVTA